MVSEGGGQGLVTLACFQDLSQARQRWPAHAEGFPSLFGTTVVLPGIGDVRTLEALSLLAGDEELLVRSASVGRTLSERPLTDLLTGGRTQLGSSVATEWRRRLPVDLIARGTPRVRVGLRRTQPGRLDPARTLPFDRTLAVLAEVGARPRDETRRAVPLAREPASDATSATSSDGDCCRHVSSSCAAQGHHRSLRLEVPISLAFGALRAVLGPESPSTVEAVATLDPALTIESRADALPQRVPEVSGTPDGSTRAIPAASPARGDPAPRTRDATWASSASAVAPTTDEAEKSATRSCRRSGRCSRAATSRRSLTLPRSIEGWSRSRAPSPTTRVRSPRS